ncbi:FecR family protein [Sphingobacterium bovistauri]|uniref:FecR family protein n=1 Tax=Sphingobacterium bovistauri TaxID=2781959 RepID=A0ABS7Z804_9SPHI|nr:FecR family protein [Sphingobacterium bovistauri]MCA5006321.1 FecR family protein [Sphingobacterium bovistauri]
MYQNQHEPQEIGQLLLKKINGNLSLEDEQVLKQWLSADPRNQALYARCIDPLQQKQVYAFLNKIDTSKAWLEIQTDLEITPTKIHKSNRYIWRYSVAAACALLIGSIFLWTKHNNTLNNTETITKLDYKPASNKAIIKLSNGESFTLDNNQDLVEVNSKSITYSDGKTITSTDDITSAEINTPRSGYYKIILPDGTQAQLNAESSLSYPLTFHGHTREVWITGEVYFDVKKNEKQPFVVHTQRQEIQVLGTSFNVNAYDEKNSIKTSLIKGIVKVANKSNKASSSKILYPNQQSILSTGKILVKEIDPKVEIAWINGKFNFDGKHLKEVMLEISRWYDIDVFISNDVPNIEFFGGTFRNNNLSTILSLLEQNNISYTISKDKKLYIKMKN